MLNKIILFLWKIRVCLLCFAMFEQGHSTWCGPAGDGTGRSRISGRRGVRGAGGFRGGGRMRDFWVQAAVWISGCRALLPPQLLCHQCLKELRVPLPVSPGIFIYFNSLGTFGDFFSLQTRGRCLESLAGFPALSCCHVVLPVSGIWLLGPRLCGERAAPHPGASLQALPSSWGKMDLLQTGFALAPSASV